VVYLKEKYKDRLNKELIYSFDCIELIRSSLGISHLSRKGMCNLQWMKTNIVTL